jgi:hypothetical protein
LVYFPFAVGHSVNRPECAILRELPNLDHTYLSKLQLKKLQTTMHNPHRA